MEKTLQEDIDEEKEIRRQRMEKLTIDVLDGIILGLVVTISLILATIL